MSEGVPMLRPPLSGIAAAISLSGVLTASSTHLMAAVLITCARVSIPDLLTSQRIAAVTVCPYFRRPRARTQLRFAQVHGCFCLPIC